MWHEILKDLSINGHCSFIFYGIKYQKEKKTFMELLILMFIGI